MSIMQSRYVFDHDHDGYVLVTTRSFLVSFGSVDAEQMDGDPWVVWFTAGRGRDYTPPEAREFAAAMTEAADFADAQNQQGAER